MDRNALNTIPLGVGAPNNLVRSNVSQVLQQVSGATATVRRGVKVVNDHTCDRSLRCVREAAQYGQPQHTQEGKVVGRNFHPIYAYSNREHTLTASGRSNRFRLCNVDQLHVEVTHPAGRVNHLIPADATQEHLQNSVLNPTQWLATHVYAAEDHGSFSTAVSGCLTAIHVNVDQVSQQEGQGFNSPWVAQHTPITGLLTLEDHVIAYDLNQEWAPVSRRIALSKESRSVAVGLLDTTTGAY